MKLTINLPSEVFLELDTAKVKAEGLEGHFTLLPNHIDMAAALTPGLFSYVPAGAAGGETYLALSEGVLVKTGEGVSVAVRAAAKGELGTLHAEVERMMDTFSESERKVRTSVARMEAAFLRRFLDFHRFD